MLSYMLKVWFWNILIWLDQGLNVLLAPLFNLVFKPDRRHMFGAADETLSSVFGKNRGVNPLIDAGRRSINKLFFWQEDHCQEAIEWDEKIKYHRD